MNVQQLKKATVAALLSSAALSLSHGNAQAISCFAALGPGGSYVLDSDLNCPFSTALTLVGPVTLDLNGHTIL